MKKLIKIIFPEPIKKKLRRVENFFYRLRYAFTKPILLKDTFGNTFVLYPEKSPSIRSMIGNGDYQNEFAAMRKIVHAGHTVFDIGANVGFVSLFLARIVSNTGRVFAFEPLPETFRRLEEAFTLNTLDNITPIQAAVSSTSGQADFHYYRDMHNSQFNSLGQVHSGKQAFNDKVSVRTISLDDYCANNKIERIDFLKIDVEGFELDVLKGAERLLSENNIGAIQFEVSESLLSSINRKSEDIFGYLRSKKYHIYEFDPVSDTFKGPIGMITKPHANYYASHTDLARAS